MKVISHGLDVQNMFIEEIREVHDYGHGHKRIYATVREAGSENQLDICFETIDPTMDFKIISVCRR